MERVPPEVWERVFGNLVTPIDLQNASNTCQLWSKVLQPTKSSWMFATAFPHLQTYLSVNEALKCRSVCKLWLHGVNNYLLNNAHFRPTFEEPGSPESLYKTDQRLHSDGYPSRIFRRVVDECSPVRNDTICKVSYSYICAALVGRWFGIFVSPTEPLSQLKRTYAESLGSQIWFLHFYIFNADSLTALKLILEYLPLFQNLKRLRLEVWLSFDPFLSSHKITKQLYSYLETHVARERIQKLPKCLETLDMGREGSREEFKQVVLKFIMSSSGATLQSVILGDMSDVACLETGSIVDLSVILASSRVAEDLLRIKSPVRRLILERQDTDIPTEDLFRVATHFRESLRNFHLQLNYRHGDVWKKNPKYLEPLTNLEVLKDLKNVKRMSVEGYCFLSLNFLCGLSRSLEYLHILDILQSEDDEKKLTPCLQRIQFKEELDLLKTLREFAKLKERKIVYESNVWKVFPKLRELTIKLWGAPTIEIMFRRDVYDKLTDNALAI